MSDRLAQIRQLYPKACYAKTAPTTAKSPCGAKIQPAQAGFAEALATVAVTLAVAFFEYAIALTL